MGPLPATSCKVRFVAGLLIPLTCASAALAEEAPRLRDDEWPIRSTGRLALDGGLVMGRALTLDTGMATGVGAGLTYGRRFAVGARAAWASASETSLVWSVTHDDYRLRGVAVVQQPVGRGVFGLRLGAGASIVHESRTRNQGQRAGLTGSALMGSTTALLPGGELEAVVSVHVAGPWLLAVSGGPAAVDDGGLRAGWTAQFGVGWQP
ncbi:MAG TPA: hypothetical protein VHL80_20245 [Polyangia bacterium]|nr:hypothetical protein [Polyangia bacterium]